MSLTPEMMRTAVWLRNRYLCRYIDTAVRCFTPAGEKAKRRENKVRLLPGREDGTGSGGETLTEQQTEARGEDWRGPSKKGKHSQIPHTWRDGKRQDGDLHKGGREDAGSGKERHRACPPRSLSRPRLSTGSPAGSAAGGWLYSTVVLTPERKI